jgi:uncharacterized protein YegJ (DUF2314 family)
MAYRIDRYNNTVLTVVEDGTVDQTTDLKFIGKNYAGYGEIQNENFLYLLENFSGANPPPRAVSGQLWFDSAALKLKFYDGVKWRSTGGTAVSPTAPTGLTIGDLWWDSSNEQLYAFNGSTWILIGPQKAGSGETRMISITVKDTAGTNQNIIIGIINDEVIMITSQTEFDLNSVQPANVPVSLTTGFDRIRKGITLVNTKQATEGVTTPAQHWFWGTASNANKFGGLTVNEFVETYNNNEFDDTGISIGNDLDLKIYIENGDEGVIEHQTGGIIKFKTRNSSNDVTQSVTITAGGIEPGATSIYNLGLALKKWNTVFANTFDGEATKSQTLKYGTGQYAAGSVSATQLTAAIRDSSGSLAANIFQGIATTTRYADLAEKYTTEKEFPVGTVMAVCTHGVYETCAANENDNIVGVISENPGLMMNAELENGQFIGLKGRVPVRISGPVTKGQAVYACKDGVASANATGQLVGIALASDASEEEKLVECVLKV